MDVFYSRIVKFTHRVGGKGGGWGGGEVKLKQKIKETLQIKILKKSFQRE